MAYLKKKCWHFLLDLHSCELAGLRYVTYVISYSSTADTNIVTVDMASRMCYAT